MQEAKIKANYMKKTRELQNESKEDVNEEEKNKLGNHKREKLRVSTRMRR